MARRKKKTAKVVARDPVTLDSVFTGIANAIRAKGETSDPIYPVNMGNAIRGIKGVTEASLPEFSLPAIFQDIADAIRACGVSGTMTATQMALKVADIHLPQPTRVTYTQESGLSDWSSDISGEIAGTSTTPYYTSQIPNAQYIETVSIGDNVTSIGSSAFRNCSSLKTVAIPSSMTNIESSAFRNCSSLTDITIPTGQTSIESNTFRECSSLESITIPSTVTSIGISAFLGCSALTSLTIPNSVTSIATSVFRNCTSLEKINLSSNITSIPNYAFSGDAELTEIAFPSGLTTIGIYAFNDCTNCELFDFRIAQSVPTLHNINAFQNTPSNKEIIVPDSLYDDWISASNWSSTTNNIVNCIVKASQSSLGTL